MVQLEEYHPLGQSTGLYPYNAVAPEAPIDLVQLWTVYQISTGRVKYHDFENEIKKVARLSPTNERFISLLPFVDCADLIRRLGTLKYLMSPWKSGYDGQGKYWHRQVPYRGDVYLDEQEQLESGGAAASNPSYPDPLDQRFLPPDLNVYQPHFDVPMFKFLSPTRTDFQAAHRRSPHCRNHVFNTLIGDMASSLVNAKRFDSACRILSRMGSTHMNISVDFKPILEGTLSRFLLDTPSALVTTMSARSSLLGGSRSPTTHGGESTRELVSFTTLMPPDLVRVTSTVG